MANMNIVFVVLAMSIATPTAIEKQETFSTSKEYLQPYTSGRPFSNNTLASQFPYVRLFSSVRTLLDETAGPSADEVEPKNMTSENTDFAEINAAESCKPADQPKLERCDYVKANEACKSADANFHYLKHYFCSPVPDLFKFSGMIAYIVILFFALAESAEHYFCPALQKVSNALRLTPDVAGATLLAFGNGAPDLFTDVAAVDEGPIDLPMAIGFVLGAGNFVVTIVVALVIYMQPGHQVTLDPVPFVRDLGFYIFAVIFVAGAVVDGSLDRLESILLLVAYSVYALVVIFGSNLLKRAFGFSPPNVPVSDVPGTPSKGARPPIEEGLLHGSDGGPKSAECRVEEAGTVNFGDESPTSANPLFKQLCTALDWEHRTLARKMGLPISLVLEATMPNVNSSEFSVLYICVLVVCAPIFTFTTLGYSPAVLITHPGEYTAVYAIFGATLLLGTTYVLNAKPAKVGDLTLSALSFVSFFQAILWMYVVSTELVAAFEAVGRIVAVDETFFGETVLAWGASIGDLVANTAVARHGTVAMAFSACFAGPIFNLLLGLGLPMLYVTSGGEAIVVLLVSYTVFLVLTMTIMMEE
eukprot:gene14309-16921_t